MLYFDTSVLIPLVLSESTSAEVHRFIKKQAVSGLATSHWTRVECSSVLAREVRMKHYLSSAALKVDADLESLIYASFEILAVTRGDLETAKLLLQKYETGLRAGDALHLAIAKNNHAQMIYSLDDRMIRAGRLLGLPVSRGIDRK
ncbi:MAG: type II toxin-antitoxin system VapC family toxin [Alphaproteobacteria bacterium]|nr:type II toxin-antitoxin system VapC family toxin [Alphaproteobacteria bacterium]